MSRDKIAFHGALHFFGTTPAEVTGQLHLLQRFLVSE